MIDLVIQAIEKPLCDMISQLIIDGTTDYMNDMMRKSGYYWKYEKYPDVIKDDRFVDGMEVHKGYMIIKYAGYVYYQPDLTDEYITRDMLNPITYNYFNYHMGFQIRRAGFNNAFYIFHKYYDAYSKEGVVKVTEPPTVDFFNNAALFNVKGMFGDS